MGLPSSKKLISGYWGVNPSDVVDAYSAAWNILSGAASGLLPGTSPRIHSIRFSDKVSPGLDGLPTYGYPAPAGDPPSWICIALENGPLLIHGPDFTVSDDYIWFFRDPFFDEDGRTDIVGDVAYYVIDLWYGTVPSPEVGILPLPATAYALARSVAETTDSPATGPVREIVEDVWQAGDDSWRVITDLAAYRLPAADTPSVAVDDVLAPGTPVGSAWTLEKLDFRTASDYITIPAEMMQGVTEGDVTWHAAKAPLLVDEVDGRTRVRFRLGAESQEDLDAIWLASMDNGLENDRTLAQALDTRANPVDDPDSTSLPAVISPMGFLSKELLAGCAYRLILKTDRFGAAASSVAVIGAKARTAAGSYAAVILWLESEPYLNPNNPSDPIDEEPHYCSEVTSHLPGDGDTTCPDVGMTVCVPENAVPGLYNCGGGFWATVADRVLYDTLALCEAADCQDGTTTTTTHGPTTTTTDGPTTTTTEGPTTTTTTTCSCRPQCPNGVSETWSFVTSGYLCPELNRSWELPIWLNWGDRTCVWGLEEEDVSAIFSMTDYLNEGTTTRHFLSIYRRRFPEDEYPTSADVFEWFQEGPPFDDCCQPFTLTPIALPSIPSYLGECRGEDFPDSLVIYPGGACSCDGDGTTTTTQGPTTTTTPGGTTTPGFGTFNCYSCPSDPDPVLSCFEGIPAGCDFVSGPYASSGECISACSGSGGDCCGFGASNHPDFDFTVSDGPDAGTYTAEWSVLSELWVLQTAVFGADILFECVGGIWTLNYGGVSDWDASTQACDPLNVVWDDPDLLVLFGTTQPMVLSEQ